MTSVVLLVLLVVLVLVFGVNLCFARWVYYDAEKNGMSRWLWVWLAVMTPGMILAYLALSRRRGRKDRDLY